MSADVGAPTGPATALVPGEAAGRVTPSGIREIANAAWEVPAAIRLELGEPDAGTPEHIVEAMVRATREGATRYTPTGGLPALREAIAGKLAAVNGIPVSPDEVAVSAGGAEGLFATYRALLDEGDEVLVPGPGWPNLANLAHLAGAVPVPYACTDRDGWLPTIDGLDALATSRTRAVVVNWPANPTGAVAPLGLKREVVRWAARRGLWVVADECYDELWLDEPGSAMAAVEPGSAVVSVFSFSKTHAMTGFRLGYVTGPPAAMRRVLAVQETALSCVSTPVQHAGIAALTGSQEHVVRMRATYRRRRETALTAADAAGLAAVRPEGAFYLWLRWPGDVPSRDVALRLLREHRVALAPGSAFGAAGEGHLRISLAAPDDAIVEGLRRLAAARGDPS